MARKRKGGKLPSYEDLLKTAARVAKQTDPSDAVAIAGGLAMQIWGSPRLTADLDLIAGNDLGYEGSTLSFGGVRTKEGSVPLDIIIRDDEFAEMYEEALEKAEDVDDDEIPLLVISPEYLVAMKMVAGRAKDETDIRYLVLLDDFDHEEAEEIVREFLGKYAVKELRSLTEEAKWRRSRGEES